MILECSHVVHACNRGHWPLWMKFPIFRPSCAGLPAKPVASKSKSYALQRMSGKMFHHWGEVCVIINLQLLDEKGITFNFRAFLVFAGY